MSDYPDAELVENLRFNMENNRIAHAESSNVAVEGYLWGANTDNLVRHIGESGKFDRLVLADLLFNHSEHAKLVQTIQQTLKRTPDATALVWFTPYRPWLLEKDLAFFDLARQGGFKVQKIYEKVMENVMFQNDPGVPSVHSTFCSAHTDDLPG